MAAPERGDAPAFRRNLSKNDMTTAIPACKKPFPVGVEARVVSCFAYGMSFFGHCSRTLRDRLEQWSRTNVCGQTNMELI